MRSGNDANVDNLGELDRAFGLWRGVLRHPNLFDPRDDTFAIGPGADRGPSHVSFTHNRARAIHDKGADVGPSPAATGADR